jgi:hypothetical protein
MPLEGTMEVGHLLDAAPFLQDLKTEALEIKGATVLQVMYEIDDTHMVEMLPKAFHPTIPPTVTWVFYKCQGSPIGSFTYAQVRVGCRAGVRPRGYPTAGFIDDQQAAKALTERWGFPCTQAEVFLRRYYDRVVGTVNVDGRNVLDVSLIDPEAISGGDIQYVANMNLARVRYDDGEVKPRLVQVDPEFTFHRAERGRPKCTAFDAKACGEERLVPTHGVSASYAVCDIQMPKIRYVCDPDVLTMQGTEKVG